MSPRGGRGGRDGKSFPSILSIRWGRPVFPPLDVVREFAEIWAGHVGHWLETCSHPRGVRVKLPFSLCSRPFCGVLNPATSAWALDCLPFCFQCLVLYFILQPIYLLFPPRHLRFSQSTSKAECVHGAALGPSHSPVVFMGIYTCLQPTCSGRQQIHITEGSTGFARTTQFPTADNLTLTCLIIPKGWQTPSS